MDCGTGQVLGFTTEATNLLMGLWESIRVKINVRSKRVIDFACEQSPMMGIVL
jgi:hypothetical protein